MMVRLVFALCEGAYEAMRRGARVTRECAGERRWRVRM